MKQRLIKLLRLCVGLKSAKGRRIFFVTCVNILLKITRRGRGLITRLSSSLFRLLPRGAFKSYLYGYLSVSGAARCYIRPSISIETFFKALNDQKISYVILRWYEDLPTIKQGEDIDILIADNDLKKIRSYLTRDPAGQAVDLYSVSGLRGSDYLSTPYMPPHISAQIVDNHIYHNDIYAVPATKDAVLSMAYHIVFHKGSKSALPYDKNDLAKKKPVDHDYGDVLKRLADKADFVIDDYSYLGLYKLLEMHNWLPEKDTLRLYAARDHWIKLLLPAKKTSLFKGALTTFVIRDWALAHSKIEEIKHQLVRAKFDILDAYMLDDAQKKKATDHIRGGKWDRGSFAVSGGAPVALIACYDYHPITPNPNKKKLYPYLENGRNHVKHTIRDMVNAELLLSKQVNPIHASDDCEEAWDYLSLCLDESQLSELSNMINHRDEIYFSDHGVLETLSADNTRSKTEKILYDGKMAVKKTFKHGFDAFCAREAFVYETFSDQVEFIPPLLEKTENYIIIPWFDDVLGALDEKGRKALLKQHKATIIDAMRFFYDQGYALIGFYDQNVMITASGQVVLIDFEFLYRYKNKPATFEQSYDLIGVPKDFEGDLPRGITGKGHTYKNTWQAYLGKFC